MGLEQIKGLKAGMQAGRQAGGPEQWKGVAHGRRPFKPRIITWKPSHNITPLCSTARNHRSDFTAECTFSSSFPYKAVMVVGGGLNWVFSGASRSFQDGPTLGRQLNTSHQLQMVPLAPDKYISIPPGCGYQYQYQMHTLETRL